MESPKFGCYARNCYLFNIPITKIDQPILKIFLIFVLDIMELRVYKFFADWETENTRVQ